MITDPELTLTRDTIANIRAELAALESALPTDPVPPDPPSDEWPDELPSPTGADPVLCWSPHWQAVWYRMQTESDQGVASLGATWYAMIRDWAQRPRYADTGITCALMYQATGDPHYATLAVGKMRDDGGGANTGLLLLTPDTPQLIGNLSREWLAEWVLVTHWIWTALTNEERAECLAQLDMVLRAIGVGTEWNPDLRKDDSDQVVGVYFGVAFYHLAFKDVHEPAAAMWSNAEIGGFDVTGQNRLTLRNCVADYVRMAAGGEWIESAGYNPGTMKLLVMGYLGCLSALGEDRFPEIRDWLIDGANRSIYMLTPDRTQPIQWGDDQDPRDLIKVLYKYVGLSMLCGTPDSNELVHALTGQYGAVGYQSAEPATSGVRGFLNFDPYGPRRPVEELPRVWFATGQGILTARSSWDPDAAVLFAHFPPDPSPELPVDHTVGYFGDVQIWNRRAWTLTHPIGYMGFPISGEGCNVAMYCGWGSPKEFRGALCSASWTDADYVAGTCGGDVLPAKYWDPPEHWFHEGSRSILRIAGDPDLLIVFDRSHVLDPRRLPKYLRYSDTDRARMDPASLRATYWHSPVEPSLTWDGRLMWPGVQLVPLDSCGASIINESDAWGDDPTIASERKWSARITYPDYPEFLTALTVLAFTDDPIAWVGLDGNGVRGVQIVRPGHPDVVALFNTVAGPATRPRVSDNTWDPWNRSMLATVRQCGNPFTASWVAEGDSTDVYLPERDFAVERVNVPGRGNQTISR